MVYKGWSVKFYPATLVYCASEQSILFEVRDG